MEIPVIQCNYLAEHRKSETFQLFDFVIQPCKDLRERESLLRMPMPPLRKGGRKRSAVGNFGLDEIKSLNCANEIVMDFGVLHAKFEMEVGFAWRNQNE